MINISRRKPTIVLEKCDLWKEAGGSAEVKRGMEVVVKSQDVSLSNETITLTSHQVYSSSGFNKPSSRLPAAGALNTRIEKQRRETCERESPDISKSPEIVLKKCNIAENNVLSGKTKKKLRKEKKISRLKKLMSLIEKGPKIVIEKCDVVKNVEVSNKSQSLTISNDTISYPATVIEREAIDEEPEIIFEVFVASVNKREAGFEKNNIKKVTGGVLNECTTEQKNYSDDSILPLEINVVEVEKQVEVTSETSRKTCISKNLGSKAEVESTMTQDKNKSSATIYHDTSNVPAVEIYLEEIEEQSEVSFEENLRSEPENLLETCSIQVGNAHLSDENTDLTSNYDCVLSRSGVVKIENDSGDESSEFYSVSRDSSSRRISARAQLPSRKASGKACLCANTAIKVENQTEEQNVVTHELVGYYNEDSLPVPVTSNRTNDVQSLLKTVKCEKDDLENSAKKLYTCSYCSSDLGLKMNLARHLRKCVSSQNESIKTHSSSFLKETPKSRSKQNLYTCTHCSENFCLKMNLIEHMKIHTTNKLLSCWLCPTEFYSESNLQAHMKTHGNNLDSDMFKKLSDEKLFSKRQNQMQKSKKPPTRSHHHVTLKETSQNAGARRSLRKRPDNTTSDATKLLQMKTLLACAYCSARFQTKQALKYHTKTHTTENLFSCKYCPAKFIQRAGLLSHLKMHTKPFFYKNCSGKLRQKIQSRNHSILHTRERSFRCPCCPARFIQKTNLQKHFKVHTTDEKKHNNQKLLSCTFCGGKFSTTRSLGLHSRIHSDQKSFSCMYCSTEFLSEISLQTHMNHFHANEPLSDRRKKSVGFKSADISKRTSKKPLTQATFSAASKLTPQLKKGYPCPHCSVTFCQKTSLKLHMRKHVNVDKSNKVELHKMKNGAKCSTSLKFTGALKRHANTHTAKFTQKAHLLTVSKAHSDTPKKGENSKFFPCSSSSNKYGSRQALSAHLKSHSKNKPLYCVYCSTGFLSDVKLRIHMNKNHGKDSLSSLGAKKYVKICTDKAKSSRVVQNSRKPTSGRAKKLVKILVDKPKSLRVIQNSKKRPLDSVKKCVKIRSDKTKSPRVVQNSKKRPSHVAGKYVKSCTDKPRSTILVQNSKKLPLTRAKKLVKILADKPKSLRVIQNSKKRPLDSAKKCVKIRSDKTKSPRVVQNSKKRPSHVAGKYVKSCTDKPRSSIVVQNSKKLPYTRAKKLVKILADKPKSLRVIQNSKRQPSHVAKECVKICADKPKSSRVVQNSKKQPSHVVKKYVKTHADKPRCPRIQNAQKSQSYGAKKFVKIHAHKPKSVRVVQNSKMRPSHVVKKYVKIYADKPRSPSVVQNTKKLRTQENLPAPSKHKCQQPNLKMLKRKRRFSCPCCGTNFCQEAGLKLHMIKHADTNKCEKKKQPKIEKVFTCVHCRISFKSKCALQKHTLVHAGKRLFCCSHCSAKFVQKSHLLKHSKKHNNQRSISCVYCYVKFQTVQALCAHSKVHSDKKPFPCGHCSSGFTSKQKLQAHLKKCTNDKSLSCISTSVKFFSSNTRKLQNSKKPFKRANPSVTSKQKAQLKNAKMSKTKGWFSCTHCSATFRLKTNLTVHMKKHANYKKISKVKSLKAEKIFNCTHCSVNFKSLQALGNHIKTHIRKNSHSCKCCPATFKREDILKRHQSTHSRKKLFSCGHCSSTFKRKYGLERHLYIHSK